MPRDHNTLPRRDEAEQIRDKLQELRARDPANYAHRSARALKDLERLSRPKHRYAKT